MWALWDIHEMAYLIHGLLRDHELFGEKRSLEAAKKIADYIVTRWSAEPDRKPGGGEITVLMAITGLEPALLKLHEATGERRYLDFCVERAEAARVGRRARRRALGTGRRPRLLPTAPDASPSFGSTTSSRTRSC